MTKTISDILIVGDGPFAEIAFEYFTKDSDYKVVGFAVEEAYISKEDFQGLRVYPLEDIENFFNPTEYGFYVAIPYNQLNRLRTRLLHLMIKKGFNPVNYISSKSFIWPNCKIGKHVFIFEHNVVQPFSQISDNVILWSGNHIGHHSIINENVFVSSHVVISGFCEIGRNSFLGVNSTVANNVNVAPDTFVGMSASVARNTKVGDVIKAPKSEVVQMAAYKIFGVPSDDQ